MYDFPYVKSYEKLEGLFDAVVKSEVPEKFTYRYLADIGFASSKDRDMLPALKMLGFVDYKGHPSGLYRRLRDPNTFKQCLREAIEDAYAGLLKEHPNAANVSENVSTGYFRKLTGASHEVSRVYQGTFAELMKLADYREVAAAGAGFQEIGAEDKSIGIGKEIGNINININLPITTDEKVYEALFKHLKDLIVH